MWIKRFLLMFWLLVVRLWGDEELEESEFEPFFSDLEGKASGKKVALFGSYDWGDESDENMVRQSKKTHGAELVEDGRTQL